MKTGNAGKRRNRIMGLGIFLAVAVLCAWISGRRARQAADDAIGRLPCGYVFYGQRFGLFQTPGKYGVGWIVAYDDDSLGYGAVRIYVSMLGNVVGANMALPGVAGDEGH